jgi:hypothetical protein
MHLIITGSLILLLGLPYLAVFLHDWHAGTADPIAGIVIGLLNLGGAFLLYSGIQSQRLAEQGLATWPRVQAQIIDVQYRVKPAAWVMEVKWKDPKTGETHSELSETFDVHPKYARPDMTIPVALNPERPGYGVIDLAPLKTVGKSESPGFSVGEWLLAYLDIARKPDAGGVVLAIVLLFFPGAFIVLGAMSVLQQLAEPRPAVVAPVIALIVGLALLAGLLWLFAPREALIASYLKEHGSRTDVKVLGIEHVRDDRWSVVLQWPGGGYHVESMWKDPKDIAFALWRDRKNPRIWALEQVSSPH